MINIENELKDLCDEFMVILDKLKEENLINRNEYDEYSEDKIDFLKKHL